LWNDIIEQSNSIAVSKECQSLCFENIGKLYGCSKFQILLFVVLQPDFWFWKARFSAKECTPSRLVISLFNCPTLKGHFLHLLKTWGPWPPGSYAPGWQPISDVNSVLIHYVSVLWF
jgi:hypothetical protein